LVRRCLSTLLVKQFSVLTEHNWEQIRF